MRAMLGGMRTCSRTPPRSPSPNLHPPHTRSSVDPSPLDCVVRRVLYGTRCGIVTMKDMRARGDITVSGYKAGAWVSL